MTLWIYFLKKNHWIVYLKALIYIMWIISQFWKKDCLCVFVVKKRVPPDSSPLVPCWQGHQLLPQTLHLILKMGCIPPIFKFVGRSFQLNVLGLKKFNFRVVLTAMLGDFYFKRRKKKKKKSSNKMFTLEVRASWFPEGRSLHQLVAAPKQIPSRELTPVPLLCSAGNDCEF